MNSQMSTIQTKAPANKTTAESVENISAMKRLLKIKTYQMTFRQIAKRASDVMTQTSLRQTNRNCRRFS